MKKCFFCEHDRGPLMDRSDICSTCHDSNNFQVKKRLSPREMYEYEKLKKEEEWANDNSIEFDRNTALRVLSDLSHRMYPNHDIFGKKTLVITRDAFELVRKKYLDKK